VLKAFHVVNDGDLSTRFFDVERSGRIRRLVLTDELLGLMRGPQSSNFPGEVDARWAMAACRTRVETRPECEPADHLAVGWRRSFRQVPVLTQVQE
jgi:hypothetical protein